MEPTNAERDRNLDRELNELLQETRVVQGGILLLVGFELVVAFSSRWTAITEFEKAVYFATLLVTGTSAVTVMAPVVHHRLAFRRRDKERVIVRGNIALLVSVLLVAVSILGITVLVSDVVYGFWASMVVGVLYIGLVTVLWVLLPAHSLRIAHAEHRHPENQNER